MFYAKGLKTGVMDIPLMVAKCLYEVPNLYGENIRNNKKTTDKKSGGVGAGKVCLKIHNRAKELWTR